MPAKSPDEPTTHADAGDGVELSGGEASQGAKGNAPRRVLIVLGTSLVLVFIALFGALAFHSPGLSTSKTGSEHSKDVSTFAAPQPSPRPNAPATVENGGRSSADRSGNAQ